MRFALVVMVLFVGSLLVAQEVNPSSLNFVAVPPNTSPQESMSFVNVGTTPLTVTVTVSGPFVVAQNRCGNGVKPKTHCNVYLTYTPQSVGEVDNGALTVNYGSGVATVQLTGQGVSSIPTSAAVDRSQFQCDKVHLGDSFAMEGKLWVEDPYYALPSGESASFSCTNGQETIDLGSTPLSLCRRGHCPGGPYDVASASVAPDQVGTWTCTMTYDGDGIFAPASGGIRFEVGLKYKNRKCNVVSHEGAVQPKAMEVQVAK